MTRLVLATLRQLRSVLVPLLPFLLAAAGLFSAPAVGARTVLEFESHPQPVMLEDWGDMWLDASGKLGAPEVADRTDLPWAATAASHIQRLEPGQVLWIRFTVPPTPDHERWYLEVPAASVDRLTLYTLDRSGQWVGQEAGDHVAVASWPVPHRHPLLPVAVSAEEPQKFLLRVENTRLFAAPLGFVSEQFLSAREQRTSFALGAYFGLAALAACMALIMAVILRDKAFATAALAIATVGLAQAGSSGVGGLFLWSHAPRWNDVSFVVLPVLAAGTLVACFAMAASIDERSPRLFQGLLVLSLLCVPGAIAVALVPAQLRYLLLAPYLAVASAACVAISAWAARLGDRYALLLLLSAVPVVGAAIYPLARTLGLAPADFWSSHATQIGTAIEWPILLAVLMLRSQHKREIGKRVQGLDHLDPETGLINAFELGRRLKQLEARSRRLRADGAVLLVRIANMEDLQRDFGAQLADEVPLYVGKRLVALCRDIDAVGRVDVNTFALLLEGPLYPKELQELCARIVAHCLMPWPGKPMALIARTRIAHMPVPGCHPAGGAVAQLQALLDAVPRSSRRVIFPLCVDSAAETLPSRLEAETEEA